MVCQREFLAGFFFNTFIINSIITIILSLFSGNKCALAEVWFPFCARIWASGGERLLSVLSWLSPVSATVPGALIIYWVNGWIILKCVLFYRKKCLAFHNDIATFLAKGKVLSNHIVTVY